MTILDQLAAAALDRTGRALEKLKTRVAVR